MDMIKQDQDGLDERDSYIDATEVARLLGYSVTHVRRLLRESRIPNVKMPGGRNARRLVSRQALGDWLAQNASVDPTGQPPAPRVGGGFEDVPLLEVGEASHGE